MTRISYILMSLVFAGLTVAAQADDMKMPKGNMSVAKPAAASIATHHGVGQIKKVTGNTVFIAHQAIKSLNWPAMTMPFEAKDKALLAGLEAGNKVAFDFVEDNGKSVLTGIEPR